MMSKQMITNSGTVLSNLAYCTERTTWTFFSENVKSYRSLCAARFHRNKFFMMDILSESVVINSMKIMRQEQLDSLSVHRKVRRNFYNQF